MERGRNPGETVMCGLVGKVPGPEKSKNVQEVTARAPWWKPGSVRGLKERVGFLEEVRWVNWHSGKCGKKRRHQKSQGATGGQGECVHLGFLSSWSSRDSYFCQFHINIYITSRLRDYIIYIYMEAGWNWGDPCVCTGRFID